LNDNQQASLAYDNQIVQQLLQQVNGMEQYFTNKPPVFSPESTNTISNVPSPQKDTQVKDDQIRQ